jgi:hypothetical protein
MQTYKCPKCGSEDVKVIGKAAAHPTEQGVEDAEPITWDETSEAYCNGCDWSGQGGDLTLSPASWETDGGVLLPEED